MIRLWPGRPWGVIRGKIAYKKAQTRQKVGPALNMG